MKISTVLEYNKKQAGAGMIFQTKSGKIRKRGFVVSFKGEYIYKPTKNAALEVCEKDFEPTVSPIWWNANLGMSNLEAYNR